MDEDTHFDDLRAALETSLCPTVLFERMQLIDEKLPPAAQCPRGLGEDVIQVLDVFQNQIASDKVEGIIRAIPGLGDVCQSKSDMVCRHFLAGSGKHLFGEIDCQDRIAQRGKELGVLPRPAADLQNGWEALSRKEEARHLGVEVTGGIRVRVVDIRPFVVSVLYVHAGKP